MTAQEEGLIGRAVGGMIRRSVRNRFRSGSWLRPHEPIQAPAIFYANHHGWMDGYLMFHVVGALGLRSVDWIEEFDGFPLFSRIGGMRFATGDVAGRAATIRRTIKLMNGDRRSLVVFPEGVLHRPPELLPFGRAMATVARRVPDVSMVPVSIRYELSMHERPEAWVMLGRPHRFASLEDCEQRLGAQLLEMGFKSGYTTLVEGRRDVNERMDMRRIPGQNG